MESRDLLHNDLLPISPLSLSLSLLFCFLFGIPACILPYYSMSLPLLLRCAPLSQVKKIIDLITIVILTQLIGRRATSTLLSFPLRKIYLSTNSFDGKSA